MLLEKRDNEARKRHAGTIERMNKLRLTVGIFEPAVETTRLIVREATAARDLEPLLFSGSPKLEIVALCGLEAHVARADLKDA